MSTSLVAFCVLSCISNFINKPVKLLMALFLGLNELIYPSENGTPKHIGSTGSIPTEVKLNLYYQ